MADIAGFIADLSHYNTGVDLAAMKAGGIAAVILKTSQGATFTDPAFASRAVAARSAGLLVGAYHYYAAGVDPIAQAIHWSDRHRGRGSTGTYGPDRAKSVSRLALVFGAALVIALASPGHALTAQQQRMSDCNVQAART